MEKVILVRYGEIALKRLNRSKFERKLMSNIKNRLKVIGDIKITSSQSRIFIDPREKDFDFDNAICELTKIFGITSVSIATKIESEFDLIRKISIDIVKEKMRQYNSATFKVETKRADKKFKLKSPEISMEVGGNILDNIDNLTVDVKNPTFILYIEVREFAYIYTDIVKAQCGMPVGTNGKASLLLSGGIDSPVAGYMIAKRGVEVDAIHFYSYPYTSQRAKEKVIKLANIISSYCGGFNLNVVSFTDIQIAINENCPVDYGTIIMRRVMMKISEKLAIKNNSMALITGESIGQVASQTIYSLTTTNASVEMPVFRPLIGMDKNEVIDIARKIGTFDTSIEPYEDCCTVFVAKHPVTKPTLEKVLQAEEKLNIDDLIEKAVKEVEVIKIIG